MQGSFVDRRMSTGVSDASSRRKLTLKLYMYVIHSGKVSRNAQRGHQLPKLAGLRYPGAVDCPKILFSNLGGILFT